MDRSSPRFAIQLDRADARWVWRVLDEEGRAAAEGQAADEAAAREAAGLFRRLLKPRARF